MSVRPGTVVAIESHANPRIKAIKALALAKNRRETGLFVAEGLKLVTDALDRDWKVRTFVHRADAIAQPAIASAAARARARGGDVVSVTADILTKIARRDNPQTVIGIIEQRSLGLAEISPGRDDTWIALEMAKDPGNLGTIIRTADAVGAAGIILVGPSVDPYSMEAVRATMGSLFHVPVARASEDDFLAFARRWPGAVVGTDLKAKVDYRNAEYREPVLLVMGNEQSGITPTLAEACDPLVRIPMVGAADSLNLAVATAVMLYEIRKPHLQQRIGTDP